MSTLERLYAYAKSTGAGARENFTTEALAGAIRDHPEPVLRLLREAGLLPPGEARELSVETQVELPGTGRLDVVLSVSVGGRRHELWCEVKVEAGESGTQIDAYRRHISRIDAASRPVLFVLGPHPTRDDSSLPFVSWHRLRRLVTAADARAWRDLSDYLAEVGMSDDFDQAIAAREAASLDDFRNLHGKVARLLAETGAIASDRWPGLPWPRGEAKIRKVLFDRLATHQQLVVGVQSAKNVWLVMGTQPGDGEADLTIQVETWPSAADLQREIIGRADSAALGPEWQRTLGPWGGLRRRERLVVLGSQERASTWLLEGIEELDAAGVLELLSPPSGIE